MGERKPAIRAVAAADPPFVFPCFPFYPQNVSVCDRPGLEAEYLHIVLSDFLKYPVEWIKTVDFDSMYAAMDKGDADIFGITLDFDQQFLNRGWEATPIVVYDSYTLLIRETLDHENEPFGVFKVFSWQLWLGLILTFLGLLMLNWLGEKIFGLSGKQNHSFWTFQKVKAKFLLALWLIVLSLLMSVFTNLMSIDLIIQKLIRKLPFETFDELISKLKTKECQWIITEAYVGDPEMYDKVLNPTMDSPFPWAEGFRQAFRVNKPMAVPDREGLANAIISSDKCLVGLDYISLQTFYESRFCGLAMITKMPMTAAQQQLSRPDTVGLPALNFMYYIGANSTFFLEDFNVVLTSSAVGNLYQHLSQKYYKLLLPPACKSDKGAAGWLPVSFLETVGHFVLLSVGALLSCIAWGVELGATRFPRVSSWIRKVTNPWN